MRRPLSSLIFDFFFCETSRVTMRPQTKPTTYLPTRKAEATSLGAPRLCPLSLPLPPSLSLSLPPSHPPSLSRGTSTLEPSAASPVWEAAQSDTAQGGAMPMAPPCFGKQELSAYACTACTLGRQRRSGRWCGWRYSVDGRLRLAWQQNWFFEVYLETDSPTLPGTGRICALFGERQGKGGW